MSKSYSIKLMTILQGMSFEEHKAQNVSNKLSILELLQKKNYLLQYKFDNKISYENGLFFYIHNQISEIVSKKGWFENILFNKNVSAAKITEKQGHNLSKAPINEIKSQNSVHNSMANGSLFTQHRKTQDDDTMMSFIKDSSYIQQLLQDDGNGDGDSKETSQLNESPSIPVGNHEKKRKALQSIPIDSILKRDMTSFMQVQNVNNTELLAYDMSCMKLNQTSMIDFSVANQQKNNTSTFQPEKKSVNISQNRTSSRQTPLLTIDNSNNLKINNNMNNNSNSTNDMSMLKSILRTNYNNSNNNFHDNNNEKLACNMTTEISFLPDSNSTVITERLQQRKSLVFRQNRANSTTSNNNSNQNKKGDKNRISLFAFHENYEDIEEEDSLTYNEN